MKPKEQITREQALKILCKAELRRDKGGQTVYTDADQQVTPEVMRTIKEFIPGRNKPGENLDLRVKPGHPRYPDVSLLPDPETCTPTNIPEGLKSGDTQWVMIGRSLMDLLERNGAQIIESTDRAKTQSL